jgi:GTP cyclohydrolase-4
MRSLDIQETKPDVAISLRKVGAIGIKMPIGFVSFDNKPVMVIPTFSVFIDLPAKQKGIHASRNYEVISETLSRYVGKTYKLENLCASVARELLKRHRYATRSEVKGQGQAIFERRAPKTGMMSYEYCNIMAKAIARKMQDGKILAKKTVGVGVTGVTACPCAQEILRERSKKAITEDVKLAKNVVDRVMAKVPVATHMQRTYGTVTMDVPDGTDVNAMKLVHVIEDSMSASTVELLKRPDEGEIVRLAVSRPRFAEDSIRYMMRNVVKKFPELPNNIRLVFTARSRESIHKHDFFAQRSITMGEIRKELKQ